MITLNENIMNFLNEVEEHYNIISINYVEDNKLEISIKHYENYTCPVTVTLISESRDKYFVWHIKARKKIKEIEDWWKWKDFHDGVHYPDIRTRIENILYLDVYDEFYKGMTEDDLEDDEDLKPTSCELFTTVDFYYTEKLIALIRKHFKGRIKFDNDMSEYKRAVEKEVESIVGKGAF